MATPNIKAITEGKSSGKSSIWYYW
jgi:hypothetical protein